MLKMGKGNGADGEFVLYEDEFDNYNYEKGSCSTITLQWDNEKNVLTFGDRQGSFPGMLDLRTFHIVIVSPNYGTGVEATEEVEKTVKYSGVEQLVVF